MVDLLVRCADRRRRLALALALAGCGTPTATSVDMVDPTDGPGADATTDPGGDTATDPTTPTTGDDSTGSSTGGAVEYEPKCSLNDYSVLIAEVCAGVTDCPLVASFLAECVDYSDSHRISAAPDGDAILRISARRQLSWPHDDVTQQEIFRVSRTGGERVDVMVTTRRPNELGVPTPRADGEVDLWRPTYSYGLQHFIAGAATDEDGLADPEVRRDLESVLDVDERPDGVPAIFLRRDTGGVVVRYEEAGGGVELPLLTQEASNLVIQEVVGESLVSWIVKHDDGDFTMYSRELDAPQGSPATEVMPISTWAHDEIEMSALSPFGGGSHGVVITDNSIWPDLFAGPPWPLETPLFKQNELCEPPYCRDSCQPDTCTHTTIYAEPLALRAREVDLREWHFECPVETTRQYFEDPGLIFCDCDARIIERIEHPCELVATELKPHPDPDAPATLSRAPVWRLPTPLTHADVIGTRAELALSGDTAWVAFASDERVLVLAIDVDAGLAEELPPVDPPDPPDPPPPECGDGVSEGDEVCDGADLGGGACTDYPGFGGGELACTAMCTHDTAGCCKADGEACELDDECCPGSSCQLDLMTLMDVCSS